MLSTSCRKTGLQLDNGNNNNNNNNTAAVVVNNNNNNNNATVVVGSVAQRLQQLRQQLQQQEQPVQPADGGQDTDTEADKSLRLQACWIKLWDRWACEQRNLVLYQMHVDHAVSRERTKLTLAGGRVVPCGNKRVRQHEQPEQRPSSSSSSSSADSLSSANNTSLPPPPPPPPSPDVIGARDLRVLSTAVDRLRSSGWYYEGADAQAAVSRALARMPAGRFCVRDSRHSAHLFAMDVHTGGGRLISVRFTYADGEFRLDNAADAAAAASSAPAAHAPTDLITVPRFRCPIELIDYYVRLSRMATARQPMLVYPVWVDRSTGQFFSWMNLRRPMLKTDAALFPTLKHSARLVINRHKRLINITPTSLPNELIEYLLQYPYSL